MRTLSGLDAAFLELETPSNHMHVMAVAVLDPGDVEGGVTRDSIKRLVRARLDRLPPFRRRVVTVPFGIWHPVWVEDPGFDLDYHVRRVVVPSPAGMRELAEIVGDIASRQLDRTRPLWELWVAHGLERDRVALIAKMHHAAIDGASGVEVLAQLVDLEPSVDEPPAGTWHPERVPSEVELVLRSLVAMAGQPLRVVRAVRNLASSAARLARRIRTEPVSAGVPFTAPRLAWNSAITPHRQVAFASASLDDVRRIKDAFGVTVNDVVLAIVAGALRRYFVARGALPDRPLVAVVPTSVRAPDQRGEMGNRVSAMFTRLATDVADPAERLAAVHEVMHGAKQVHDDIGGTTLEEWAELASPALLGRGARLYGELRLADRHRPIYNLVVSNVPGPTFPLYLAGARLLSMYPMGPVFDGAGLNVTVMSYLDAIDVGFMACLETVPSLWSLAEAVPDAVAELVSASSARWRLLDRELIRPSARERAARTSRRVRSVQPSAESKSERS